MQIDAGQQKKVQPHAHVSERQIAHQEFKNRQFTPGKIKKLNKVTITQKITLTITFVVFAYLDASKTTSTSAFPNTARKATIHTDPRNQFDPMTSSHGFKASGIG